MDGGALPVHPSDASVSPHVLERRQVVPADRATVFRFFENPRNLATITPPWLRFTVHWSSDEQVRRGTEIAYRLRWNGLPLAWRSRISEYERGACFADEMLLGPYKRWYHRHLFAEVPNGIRMVDHVEYQLPLGVLGRAAHAVLIRRQLDAIFDYRRDAIAELFSGSSIGPP